MSWSYGNCAPAEPCLCKTINTEASGAQVLSYQEFDGQQWKGPRPDGWSPTYPEEVAMYREIKDLYSDRPEELQDKLRNLAKALDGFLAGYETGSKQKAKQMQVQIQNLEREIHNCEAERYRFAKDLAKIYVDRIRHLPETGLQEVRRCAEKDPVDFVRHFNIGRMWAPRQKHWVLRLRTKLFGG